MGLLKFVVLEGWGVKSKYVVFSFHYEFIHPFADDAGWAALGPVGSFISKQFNDFDSRTYGYSKLSSLVKAIGLFEYEERQAGTGKTLYVRNKTKKGR